MSDFNCPACNLAFYIGEYPDHLTDMGPNNTFEFDCDCGAVFTCDVDWDPTITPRDDFKMSGGAA